MARRTHTSPENNISDLLTSAASGAQRDATRPLAERMRPRELDDMVGQRRPLAPGTALRRTIESGNVHSMILWGPPGCGKTTLALLLARYADAEFKAISAVLSGLPEVRQVLAEAAHRFAQGRGTVLFVDEVHRFNKTQQDAFLPHIERGTIMFVGATTENPSFELNSALLSRCRVHVMEAVSVDDIVLALRQALGDDQRGLGGQGLQVADEALRQIAGAADGDVRRGLTLLEIAAGLAECADAQDQGGTISEATLAQVLADRTRRFDKGGEQFYDQISALHKSVRSSNPDAAVYWLARMLDGGCDPNYLARRLTRMAFNAAKRDVRQYGTQDVPLHLRNAPTKLMKQLGYAKGYQYDHDEAGGIALTQTGFPDAMGEQVYYQPADRGLEIKLKEKIDRLRLARDAARRSAHKGHPKT